MVELGKLNTLTVVKFVDFGLYLDGGSDGEILLPARSIPSGTRVGDNLEVFIYLDSEDMLIATTDTPKAMVGQCVVLTVVEVNQIGAFLDWGLPKDLLVPFGEQQKPMEKGQSYVVYLYVDAASERIAGTTKLDKHLAESSPYFKEKQQVDLMIYGRTDLGYKAVVNGFAMGLIFNSDVFKPIKHGQQMKGYIKRIREDKKIDLCLQIASRQVLDALSQQILDYINKHGGVISLTDKSKPEDIAKAFSVSKSSYKKALGKLYKRRLVELNKDNVTLVK